MEASRQVKEINMNRRSIMIVTMLSSVFCLTGFALGADEQHTLIKSFGSAKVSLQQGLTAAQRKGQPISGKFEVEDGKFQLSVYTANNGQFSEVAGRLQHRQDRQIRANHARRRYGYRQAQSGALAKAKIDPKSSRQQGGKRIPGLSRRQCDTKPEGWACDRFGGSAQRQRDEKR